MVPRLVKDLIWLCLVGIVAGFQNGRVSVRPFIGTTAAGNGVLWMQQARLKDPGNDFACSSSRVDPVNPVLSWWQSKQAARQVKRKWLAETLARAVTHLRRRMLAACFLAVFWLSMTQTVLAVTGGRVGGSFGKSSSSSSSSSRYSAPGRVYSRPRQRQRDYRPYYSPAPTYFYNNNAPHILLGTPSRTRVYYDGAIATRFSVADVALLGGTTGLLTYGFYNNYQARRNDGSSPLGPGATVASIVVSLNVPNPGDASSVLSRLQRLSQQATTSTRRGVQDLVTEVCLELSRQERSMVSAATESRQFSSVSLAERAFQTLSVKSRSKFDKESVNKFGGVDRSELSSTKGRNGSRATSAVVSINIAIEGDSTQLPRIRDRTTVLEALSKLASDAQVEECLLSAEVLWAPDAAGEVLTAEDVYADYPNLVPL